MSRPMAQRPAITPAQRIAAARENGRRGALATNRKYSREQKQAWGEKAGAATLARYGHSYYRFIRNCRKPKQKS